MCKIKRNRRSWKLLERRSWNTISFLQGGGGLNWNFDVKFRWMFSGISWPNISLFSIQDTYIPSKWTSPSDHSQASLTPASTRWWGHNNHALICIKFKHRKPQLSLSEAKIITKPYIYNLKSGNRCFFIGDDFIKWRIQWFWCPLFIGDYFITWRMQRFWCPLLLGDDFIGDGFRGYHFTRWLFYEICKTITL